MLHEIIKRDLMEAVKSKKSTVLDLKYILGEFSRLKGTKDGKTYIGSTLTDEQSIRVLVGIIAGEDKLLAIVKGSTSTLKPLCESYLPKKATEEEVLAFINTIDFSQLKNKMMAVGTIKKHFGTACDGKMVSGLVQNLDV